MDKKQSKEVQEAPKGRKANLLEAVLVFGILIAIMSYSILVLKVDPHLPMFIGVILAALMALYLGYQWKSIEEMMVRGITQALQSMMILMVIGILVGVWIQTGVVPSMIYYGLMILKPSIFLVATVLISSITSLATGSSWGTAGTMGIALMGVASGVGIPAPVAAGAIISGAYFGDKMSPLSDTTNLAPAMAGTDVFTHIKAMAKPTVLTYIITLGVFAFLTTRYNVVGADTGSIAQLQEGLQNSFTISPLLLLPPVVVIVAIAFKVAALPGIVIGIFVAAAMGPFIQEGVGMGEIFSAGLNGFVSETGVASLDDLLSAGGLLGMMFSVSLTMIAMMFGGIAEGTGIMEVIINTILGGVRSAVGLVTATIITAFISNVTMPEQYIAIVVPGRMFAPVYKDRGFHPKLLSSSLEASGTVTSALVPWNTCGVYMSTVLGVGTMSYMPFAVFNYLMPVVTIFLTMIGQNNFMAADEPETIIDGEFA
ncbi:MAG: Na+/H+ antiporter NhaC [Tissierellia bacterium]|nr:Na+/H+ antiporter NhaC [Tissierellia bacterium]